MWRTVAKPLIIVESPAKERTLSRFLGGQYRVASSTGHVRDLPKTSMGVDVADGFRPGYEVLPEKRDVIKALQKAAHNAEEVYLASDPDREGEAIAWHLAEALNLQHPKRIEFHEITPEAVRRALETPREVDAARVDAYHARRILDRLVGYQLSPLLSRKVHRRGLSAGRVQSVALRLICERESEIEAFVAQEYWVIEAMLAAAAADSPFKAITPFTKATRLDIGSQEGAEAIIGAVKDAAWVVHQVRKTTRQRRPRPPLITSTLQRAASARFGFSPKRTMAIAQTLYEGKDVGDSETVGLITYMRTDSVRVAESAQASAREYLRARFGSEYLPDTPPSYQARKGAQDAHEAIRPTSVDRTPEKMARFLSADELRVYTLIFETFLASQMAPATVDQVAADIRAAEHTFRASGSQVRFPGFLALSKELAPAPTRRKGGKNGNGNGEDDEEEGAEDLVLPELTEGQVLDLRQLVPNQRFTQPPPRYNEASLIAALEEYGIGRPSTYSPTVETIKARQYAVIKEKKFHPTTLGRTVSELLVSHFGDWVNTDFTAQMEEQLDSIEGSQANWQAVLAEFWGPFEQTLQKATGEMADVHIQPEATGEECPECGQPLVIRTGRFGEFVGCSAYPECRYIQREEPEETPTDVVCEKCGRPMVRKRGRYGHFLGCSGYPECKNIQREGGAKKGEPTEIACLTEGCTGHLVLRQSRRGSAFYGCSRYPKCRFTSSRKPVGGSCPQCGESLVEDAADDGSKIHCCSSRKCDYSVPAPETGDAG